MSVFEELIDELKEENLLEETVLSLNRESSEPPQVIVDPIRQQVAAPTSSPTPEDSILDVGEERLDEAEADFIEAPADERETYRRRAMDEVSSLQMVEHVLSGIEREHMKMSPETFDDLEVKKALHRYLQVTAPVSSDEHSKAEYSLFQETEKWFSALSKRDSNISVANIRRFCENSRPVLSSQALMALARFYRNSPYSEAVRGKFDFVITRLFSREIGDAKRKLLFSRIETLGHIKTLYANWASLAVLELEGRNGFSISTAVSGFEGFVRESEASDSFDQLIASDFFNHIRLFKEQTNELFFDPAVTSAAIECNVRIGNRFVDLIQKEREATSEAAIEEKYGYSHDTIISHAASKTLLLLDLVRESREHADVEPEIVEEVRSAPRNTQFERAPVEERSRSGLLSINRWLVFGTLAALILTGGIFLWSENASETRSGIEVAAAVDLSGTDLKAHLREASVSGETLYGVTEPTWEALSEDEKRVLVTKALQFAQTRGMKKVNILNSRGRTVAYASEKRTEIFGP